MSMRIVTAVALLGAAGVMSGCSVEQPSPGCQVQDGVWQAAYILKDSSKASTSCGNLKGEAIGAFKFVDLGKTPHPSYLAIRPQRAAELTAYHDSDGNPVLRVPDASVATTLSTTFSNQPDSTGLCQATGFPTATVTAPAAVDGDGTPLPAETVTYTFSDVSVYSAASAPGTQLEGTLVYGDGTGCTAEYRVLALWPQASCDTDADCGVENGLNPDFDAVCMKGINPDGSNGCVPNPAKGVPAFK